jgi:hypothetical protein
MSQFISLKKRVWFEVRANVFVQGFCVQFTSLLFPHRYISNNQHINESQTQSTRGVVPTDAVELGLTYAHMSDDGKRTNALPDRILVSRMLLSNLLSVSSVGFVILYESKQTFPFCLSCCLVVLSIFAVMRDVFPLSIDEAELLVTDVKPVLVVRQEKHVGE